MNCTVSEDWKSWYWLVGILLFVLLFFIISDNGHSSDRYCWINWAVYIHKHGVCNIYHLGSDYLPAFHYLLYLFGVICDTEEAITANIKFFKLFTFLFHLGSSFFLIRIIQMISGSEYLKHGVFYLFNIAVLYNTLVWGQVDEIISFFMIASLYCILKANPRCSILAFLLGVNFKLQSIIFLPVVLFMVIPMYREKKWKSILFDIGLFIFFQLLIFLPFILSGKFYMVLNVLFSLVDSQPYISANAYNLWFGIVGNDARSGLDSDILYIFTYKQWGLALFFIMSFIALLPLFMLCIKSLFQKTKLHISPQLTILSFGIIPLVFFFFCTQMHERYSHPSVIFIVLYSIIYRKWYLGVMISIAYLLNLDGVLKSLSFQNYGVLIFDYRVIALLFFTLIVLLYKEIYQLATAQRFFEWNSKTTSSASSISKG